MKYVDQLTASMDLLASRGAVFMGQAVACPGTGMSRTFKNVPRSQLIEMPVAEDMQLGMAIGMSLADPNQLIVSVYPRINFLIVAMNQLVLHLNALPRYSGYRPKVIIRTAIATPEPLDPGPQHLGDYTTALINMLFTGADKEDSFDESFVHISRIDCASEVIPAYRWALGRELSTILVERTELYDTEAE